MVGHFLAKIVRVSLKPDQLTGFTLILFSLKALIGIAKQ